MGLVDADGNIDDKATIDKFEIDDKPAFYKELVKEQYNLFSNSTAAIIRIRLDSGTSQRMQSVDTGSAVLWSPVRNVFLYALQSSGKGSTIMMKIVLADF